jgi:DNA polymerase-1
LDKDTIKFLFAEFKSDSVLGPALADMVTVSENSNLKTNLRGLLANMDENDRVHPNIKIMGAITGRQSVTGPAIQTFKKNDSRLRGCFLADPGFHFVSCDFQAVEARVAAALAQDKALIQTVSSGGSLHLNNALAIFGESITKDDPRYRIAKIGTFAVLYGAGAFGLSGQLGIPLSEAQEFKSLLVEAYPEAFYHFPRKMSKLKEVVTDWGRLIPLQKGLEFKASNYLIQSSARELLVDSVLKLVTKFEIPKEWVSLLIHDECVLQAPIGKVEDVASVLKEAMTGAYRGVPITSDVEVLGARWKGVES